jgi:ornithine cyclodeaminase
LEKQKVEFLYLSEPDMIKAGVLDVKKCVNVMDETFQLLGYGDYVMGGYDGNSHGCMLWYPKESRFPNMPIEGPDRRYMAMPAYLGGRFNVCGTKWYGSNIVNHKRGLPRSILMVSLNDADTGAPMAIMSANLLSAMRTGSVPGVTVKYLARPDASTVGVVGCGVISRACTRAILINMPNLKKVYLYDIKREATEQLAEEMKTEFNAEYVITNSLAEAIVDADVVSIAASGEKKVDVQQSWLKPGSLFTMTGTCRLPEECFVENRVIFDHWPMHKVWFEEGLLHKDGLKSVEKWASSYPFFKLMQDGKVKEEDTLSLGSVAAGKTKGRLKENDIVIFISGGMPVEDVAWGYAVYEEALARNLGQKLTLWDEAHWS